MNPIYFTRLLYGFNDNQLIYVNNLEHYRAHWIAVVLTVIIHVCCTTFINSSNTIEAEIQTLDYANVSHCADCSMH